MSNFTPKLVKNDEDPQKPRTINDLYDEMFESFDFWIPDDEADELDSFIRHVSHIAVQIFCDTHSPDFVKSQCIELMALTSGGSTAIPNIRHLSEQMRLGANAQKHVLGAIREHHAELSSIAKDGANSYKVGFDKAKEKYGPLVTPRELLSPEQRHEVWSKNDGDCVYCGKALAEPNVGQAERRDGVALHVDHLVPKSASGPDHMANYVPSCEPCNTSKHAKDPVMFVNNLRKQKGF